LLGLVLISQIINHFHILVFIMDSRQHRFYMHCDVIPSWNDHAGILLGWIIIRRYVAIWALKNNQHFSFIIKVFPKWIAFR
jgi:hypothetical protein